MNNPIWRLDNSHIYDEDQQVIAVIPTDVSFDKKKLLEGAPEAFNLLSRFMEELNSGRFRPKTIAKDIEITLAKYVIN